MKAEATVKAPKSLVQELRDEATKNPVFNAVAHLFAMRERARSQVTLSNLRSSMQRAGFTFEPTEYVKVLKFLADHKIGTLDIAPNKKVRALKGIKVTLQSLGKAALGQEESFEKFTPGNIYTAIPVKEGRETIVQPAPQPVKASTPLAEEVFPAVITIKVNGHPMSFDLPNGLTSKDIGDLLAEFSYKKANS